MVREEGLEPSHPKALAPKASVSTISPPAQLSVKSKCCLIEWRRRRDSNSRWLSPYFLSREAH